MVISKELLQFKKDLRYALKHDALNMYGKNVKDLSREELVIIINKIYKQYMPLYYKGSVSEYTKFFKEVFKKELKELFER